MKNSERIGQLDDRMDSFEEDLEPIWDRLNKLEAKTKSEGMSRPSEYVIDAAHFALDLFKELSGYLDGDLQELILEAIDKLEDSFAKL